jgi:hypothetical protein
MKKTIRLTESELTNLVKRLVNETSVTELPSGDFLLGGDSFFGDKPRRRGMTNMEHAEVGLKGALMMMKFLPEKISQEYMEHIKGQTEMLIGNALFLSRNNKKEMDILTPMAEKLRTRIDDILNSKLIGNKESDTPMLDESMEDDTTPEYIEVYHMYKNGEVSKRDFYDYMGILEKHERQDLVDYIQSQKEIGDDM